MAYVKVQNSVVVRLIVVIAGLGVMSFQSGCSDPAAAGRFKAMPVTNVILDSLGVVDEQPEEFSYARDPEPGDLLVDENEYVVNPGDVLDISILDLFAVAVEWRNQLQVSETGRITVPEIGTFYVAGRTELEITEEIKRLLSPEVIKDPTVSVVVIASQTKFYSVSGAVVAAPGRYPLLQPDFRMLEALAQAGGVPQARVDYAYVVRKYRDEDLEPIGEPVGGKLYEDWTLETKPAMSDEASAVKTERKAVESLLAMPGFGLSEVKSKSSVKPKSDKKKMTSEEERKSLLESISPLSESETINPVEVSESEPAEQLEAVQEKTVSTAEDVERAAKPAMVGTYPKTLQPPGVPQGSVMLSEGSQGMGQHQDVIRIDLKSLQNGDLRQNIVIRPGDYIRVQFNNMGVFYVMGQVSRPGPYSLTGERMTLKQVVAVAGPPTPLANLSRCDITRRIDRNKEVTCRINLQKLLEGSQPDIFIKPNDMVNIGSHPISRWVAVVRQSFRATYGFGFVYDRNLADKDFGN